LGERSLANAWDIFNEQVASREQAHDGQANGSCFAANCRPEGGFELGQFGQTRKREPSPRGKRGFPLGCHASIIPETFGRLRFLTLPTPVIYSNDSIWAGTTGDQHYARSRSA